MTTRSRENLLRMNNEAVSSRKEAGKYQALSTLFTGVASAIGGYNERQDAVKTKAATREDAKLKRDLMSAQLAESQASAQFTRDRSTRAAQLETERVNVLEEKQKTAQQVADKGSIYTGISDLLNHGNTNILNNDLKNSKSIRKIFGGTKVEYFNYSFDALMVYNPTSENGRLAKDFYARIGGINKEEANEFIKSKGYTPEDLEGTTLGTLLDNEVVREDSNVSVDALKTKGRFLLITNEDGTREIRDIFKFISETDYTERLNDKDLKILKTKSEIFKNKNTGKVTTKKPETTDERLDRITNEELTKFIRDNPEAVAGLGPAAIMSQMAKLESQGLENKGTALSNESQEMKNLVDNMGREELEEYMVANPDKLKKYGTALFNNQLSKLKEQELKNEGTIASTEQTDLENEAKQLGIDVKTFEFSQIVADSSVDHKTKLAKLEKLSLGNKAQEVINAADKLDSDAFAKAMEDPKYAKKYNDAVALNKLAQEEKQVLLNKNTVVSTEAKELENEAKQLGIDVKTFEFSQIVADSSVDHKTKLAKLEELSLGNEAKQLGIDTKTFGFSQIVADSSVDHKTKLAKLEELNQKIKQDKDKNNVTKSIYEATDIGTLTEFITKSMTKSKLTIADIKKIRSMEPKARTEDENKLVYAVDGLMGDKNSRLSPKETETLGRTAKSVSALNTMLSAKMTPDLYDKVSGAYDNFAADMYNRVFDTEKESLTQFRAGAGQYWSVWRHTLHGAALTEYEIKAFRQEWGSLEENPSVITTKLISSVTQDLKSLQTGLTSSKNSIVGGINYNSKIKDLQRVKELLEYQSENLSLIDTASKEQSDSDNGIPSDIDIARMVSKQMVQQRKAIKEKYGDSKEVDSSPNELKAAILEVTTPEVTTPEVTTPVIKQKSTTSDDF